MNWEASHVDLFDKVIAEAQLQKHLLKIEIKIGVEIMTGKKIFQ